MKKLFTNHPESIGETYGEHLRFASAQGFKLVLGGLACMIHSVFPFWFVTTASDIVQKFNQDITNRKNKKTSDFR